MEQFAKFVGDMKSTPDGAGTMLDHTATVYGAGLADPNVHDHDHCPTLMVGNAAGKIKTGQHVAFKQGTPLSDLHLTMLDLVGVPTDKLGNSDGQLNFLTGV